MVADQWQRLQQLPAAISQPAQADVVVDSSTEAPHAALLWTGSDTRLRWLIQDRRATAFSRSRAKVRPEITGRVEYGPRSGAVRASKECLAHVAHDFIGHLHGSHVQLRYEDFATDPKSAIELVRQALQLPDDTDPNSDGDVPGSHSLSPRRPRPEDAR
jgi:hypothetical protein